jgi:hypothetical protein
MGKPIWTNQLRVLFFLLGVQPLLELIEDAVPTSTA